MYPVQQNAPSPTVAATTTVFPLGRQFDCDTCGAVFPLYDQMKRHKQQAHTESKTYSCTYCGKVFAQVSSMRSHERCHTGERPYACQECGRGFSQKGNLKHHMMTHTGEKPFKCSLCWKSFAQRGNLKHHQRCHTGDKPYICVTCNKAFSQIASLKNHHRVHSGEKPFSCDTCHKSFSQKGNLKIHERSHTGDKPYSCDICQKTFSQISNLKIHRMSHDGQKPFSCPICGKCFSQKGNLKTHIRNHENNGNICISNMESTDGNITGTCIGINQCCNGDSPTGSNSGCDLTGGSNPNVVATGNDSNTGASRKPLFSCEVCGKEFIYRSLLKCHEKTHLVERMNRLNHPENVNNNSNIIQQPHGSPAHPSMPLQNNHHHQLHQPSHHHMSPHHHHHNHHGGHQHHTNPNPHGPGRPLLQPHTSSSPTSVSDNNPANTNSRSQGNQALRIPDRGIIYKQL